LIGQTIWQEVIEGKDEDIFQCTVLVRESGEITALFGIRKIRQFPPGYGIMCFGRSEENEIVAGMTLKLLRFLNYRGLASLEFKRQPRDNGYYFIEMNPRLPWYNALFADAGVNLPYLAYLDLTQKSELENLKPQQRNGVYWISFKADLGSFLRTRRERSESAWQWIKSVEKARSYAWWSWRDTLPFFRATVDWLGKAVQKRVLSPFLLKKGRHILL
jgi:predicted ATP-grasp superfamily ATP-dependent carboligase